MASLFDNPNLRKPGFNVLLDDLTSKGGPQNLVAGLLGGVAGIPGDIQQGAGLLSRQLPIGLQAAGSALFGRGLRVPDSEQVTGLLGGDLNRPITQAGLIGAPDPRDLVRLGGLGLLARVPSIRKKKLTPAENKFFKDIFSNDADKREFIEAVPGASFDGESLVVPSGSEDAVANYVEDTVILEIGQGNRLPPSFHKGNFAEVFREPEIFRDVELPTGLE